MTKFDRQFFKPFKFNREQIHLYFANALRDLDIAKKDPFPEVRFTYAYQAFIKGSIALIAKEGKVKVSSAPGHHVKLIEKVSEILKDEDIYTLGNAMRQKRNLDLYSGGISITDKECRAFLEFV